MRFTEGPAKPTSASVWWNGRNQLFYRKSCNLHFRNGYGAMRRTARALAREHQAQLSFCRGLRLSSSSSPISTGLGTSDADLQVLRMGTRDQTVAKGVTQANSVTAGWQ